MTRGTISGCSARSGGGVHVSEPPQNVRPFTALIDVLVIECRATGEKDDDEGGGGILVQRGAVLVI